MRKIGRPSSYSQKVADMICERLAYGESLRKICLGDNMPNRSTVIRWLADMPAFRNHYAHAREAQAEHFLDEILEIADDSAGDIEVGKDGQTRVSHEAIARAKLRIDTRKWMMSKLAPKKYGDKIDIAASGVVIQEAALVPWEPGRFADIVRQVMDEI